MRANQRSIFLNLGYNCQFGFNFGAHLTEIWIHLKIK